MKRLTIKKIILPVFSAFLIWQTYELARSLFLSEPSDFNLTQKIILALLSTLYLTGIFAFAGFAYPTNKILPHTYYLIKNGKFLKKVYRFLGVELFKKLLMFFYWGRVKNRKKYFTGTRDGMENLIFQSKQSEFGHLAALVSILLLSIFLFFRGYFVLVLIINLINLIGNLYPIILQRFHRMRIQRIKAIQKIKKK